LEILNIVIIVNNVDVNKFELIKEYKNILTKDINEKQFIRQIVSEPRKSYLIATQIGLIK
jgi:hypothetical protein